MSYSYETERHRLFTDEGQRLVIALYDEARRCIAVAGAVRCAELIAAIGGDGWNVLAGIDRLVELGRLREVTDASKVRAQHRVFVAGREAA